MLDRWIDREITPIPEKKRKEQKRREKKRREDKRREEKTATPLRRTKFFLPHKHCRSTPLVPSNAR